MLTPRVFINIMIINYFLTIIDDFIKGTWVHLMVHKSNVIQVLETFLLFVKDHFHPSAIKTIDQTLLKIV